MTILAFDTATQILNIALMHDKKFYEVNHTLGLTHSEYLLPSIDHLLHLADLSFSDIDLIVCTRGPGSFTGLRIGMATAKGLSAGSTKPVVSIPTLEIYARDCHSSQALVVPVIDARKRRYYASVYQQGKSISGDLDIASYDLLETYCSHTTVILTGPDAHKFYDEIHDSHSALLTDNAIILEIDPSYSRGHGRSLIEIGIAQFSSCGQDAAEQGPIYLRKSEAELSREQHKRH